jgi:hypothetical protein
MARLALGCSLTRGAAGIGRPEAAAPTYNRRGCPAPTLAQPPTDAGETSLLLKSGAELLGIPKRHNRDCALELTRAARIVGEELLEVAPARAVHEIRRRQVGAPRHAGVDRWLSKRERNCTPVGHDPHCSYRFSDNGHEVTGSHPNVAHQSTQLCRNTQFALQSP